MLSHFQWSTIWRYTVKHLRAGTEPLSVEINLEVPTFGEEIRSAFARRRRDCRNRTVTQRQGLNCIFSWRQWTKKLGSFTDVNNISHHRKCLAFWYGCHKMIMIKSDWRNKTVKPRQGSHDKLPNKMQKTSKKRISWIGWDQIRDYLGMNKSQSYKTLRRLFFAPSLVKLTDGGA